jgi:hypothetical protein
VQHNVNQRTIYTHPTAVVVNVAKIAKPIEEEADTGSGGPYHICQSLLTYLGDNRNGLRFLAEVSHHHQQPGEALFAGIEQMIDQISLHADVAGEQMLLEMLGELLLTLEQAQHGRLFDANDRAGLKCARRGNAIRLTRQGSFTEKAGLWKVGDYGFLAAHRYDGEIDLATLDVEDCIGQVALQEDGFTGQVFAPGFPGKEPVKEILNVEGGCRTPQSVSPVRNHR